MKPFLNMIALGACSLNLNANGMQLVGYMLQKVMHTSSKEIIIMHFPIFVIYITNSICPVAGWNEYELTQASEEQLN